LIRNNSETFLNIVFGIERMKKKAFLTKIK